MTTEKAERPDLEAAKVRIERASEHVYALCQGKARWRMSVPARPDEDSDLVIDTALRDAEAIRLYALQLEERLKGGPRS